MTQDDLVFLLRSTAWTDDRSREKQAAYILERYDVTPKAEPVSVSAALEPVEEVTQPRARVKK